VKGVEVVVVAAGDITRARSFADEHAITKVHATYADLLRDPSVDAVYISLPASLNGRWTLNALAAGKHVLVEKPMAANAAEAQVIVGAWQASGLVVFQGYHYVYHPLISQLSGLISRGVIGRLASLEAWFEVVKPPEWNIRWRYELGGGALMDHGSYGIHLARTLLGTEPTVSSVDMTPAADPRNDAAANLALDFPASRTATVRASMLADAMSNGVVVTGDEGSIHVTNYIHPSMGYRLLVTQGNGTRQEHADSMQRPTFDYQLEAFRNAVRAGHSYPTTPDDGLANLTVIDAAYRAAGLPTRMAYAEIPDSSPGDVGL
jgi:predicted dehydrogenase